VQRRAERLVARILERPRIAELRAVFDAYGTAAGGLLANGLAFAALFSTIPILLLALGMAGWLAGDPAVQERIAIVLIAAFPPLAELIVDALAAITTGAPISGLVGLVGLIWTVSQLYVALDLAFARIFAHVPERDAVRRTLRGFAWVAMLVGAVIGVIVLGSLAAFADAVLPEGFGVGRFIRAILGSAAGQALLAIAALAALYRWVPPRRPSWSALLPPAVITAVAIVALSQAFVFLAPRLVGVAALVGTIATVFIALAWFSFSFQALLLGAAWVRVRHELADQAAARP
jgi:membrane protein